MRDTRSLTPPHQPLACSASAASTSVSAPTSSGFEEMAASRERKYFMASDTRASVWLDASTHSTVQVGGKGGVGKTSLSASLAVKVREAGTLAPPEPA